MKSIIKRLSIFAIFAVLIVGMSGASAADITVGDFIIDGQVPADPNVPDSVPTDLVSGTHYSLSGNTLTIMSEYVTSIKGGADDAVLVIEAGASVAAADDITINGGTIDGELKMGGHTLTIYGEITAGTYGKLSGGTYVKPLTSADDIQETPKLTYTGSIIQPALSDFIFKTYTYVGQSFRVDTIGFDVSSITEVAVGTEKVVKLTKGSTEIITEAEIIPATPVGTPTIKHTDANNNTRLDAGDTVEVITTDITPTGGTVSYEWRIAHATGTDSVSTSKTYTLTSNHTSGNIYCIVTYTGNLVGDVETDPMGINQEELKGTLKLKGTNNTIGTKLELEGITNTNPEYTVRWYRDNETITNATAVTYTIAEEDLGTEIHAVITGSGNFTGSLTSDKREIPALKPDAPEFEVTIGDGEAVVKWSHPDDNGAKIENYYLYVRSGSSTYVSGYNPKELTGTTTSHKVEGLTNGTQYTFLLKARNDIGDSTLSSESDTPEQSDEYETDSGLEVKVSSSYVRVTIEANTSTSGTTSRADIDDDWMEEAVEIVEDEKDSSDDGIVEIVVDSSSKTTKLNFEISDNAMKEIAEGDVDELRILTDFGDLYFDKQAIDEIYELSDGDDVTFIIGIEDYDDLDEDMQDAIPDDMVVYFIEIETTDVDIDDFGNGELYVEIEYELQNDEDEDEVKVWHLATDGDLTDMKADYDENDEIASFTTDHLSYYVVGFDDLDEIEEEEEDDFDLSGLYTDVVPTDWYYDAIQYVSKNGLMTGTGTLKFSPNDTTTRAMIVTILWRMEGEPSALNYGFEDLEDGAWYEKAVNWAAFHGIVNGYSDEAFGPNDPITREQMAVILQNFTDYLDESTSASASLNDFDDKNQISSYATDAMEWAFELEFITGKTTNTIAPLAHATRAEVATILMRYCEEFKIEFDN